MEDGQRGQYGMYGGCNVQGMHNVLLMACTLLMACMLGGFSRSHSCMMLKPRLLPC